MKLKLSLNTDNAAFDDNPQAEMARILRDAAHMIEADAGLTFTVLLDFNGNRCGELKIKD